MRGRTRTIKPELFADEQLGDLEATTGLPIFRAFVGLLVFADREGRFRWAPRALKGAIAPCWEGDFAKALEALASRSFIVRYTVNGEDFGYVRNFHKHQTVHPKEAPSTLPPPETHGVTAPTLTPPVPGNSGNPNIERESVREHLGSLAPSSLEVIRSDPEAPAPRFKFRSDWRPHKDDTARGREYGLTDDEMRDRAEHCRLKLYDKPFSSEDEQWRRELLFMKKDKETQRFREQRKANPHGLDEHPGRKRKPDEPRPDPVFGRPRAG